MKKIIFGLSLFSMTMLFGSMIPIDSNTPINIDNLVDAENVSDQMTVKRKLDSFDHERMEGR